MERKTRIGIIGTGGIARAHVRSYAQIPEAQIVAVCDVVPGRAAAFATTQGLDARAFDDPSGLLAQDLDAVSVCTPNVAHHSATVAALQAGKHVLVEKPLAVTYAHAREMVDVARSTGRILSVGFQSRYDQNINLAKRVVASGSMGDLYYVDMGGGRQRGLAGGTFLRRELAGGGAVLDIGCYSIDTAMYILGHPRPLSVSAVTANHFIRNPDYIADAAADVEDFGAAFIRFEGGLTMVFKICWAMHADSLGPCLFLGAKGGLRLDVTGGLGDDTIVGMTYVQDVVGAPTRTVLPVRRPGSAGSFERKIAEFVRAVREGGPAPIPAAEILPSVAILDGLYRSAAEGREVDVRDPVPPA